MQQVYTTVFIFVVVVLPRRSLDALTTSSLDDDASVDRLYGSGGQMSPHIKYSTNTGLRLGQEIKTNDKEIVHCNVTHFANAQLVTQQNSNISSRACHTPKTNNSSISVLARVRLSVNHTCEPRLNDLHHTIKRWFYFCRREFRESNE